MTSCCRMGVELFLLRDGSNILIIPAAVAARDRSGKLLSAELCSGRLVLRWAEEEGGAASSPSLPARDMIQILQLIDCTDLAARKG